MILTSKLLEIHIVLEAAKTTNDVEFSGSYRDKKENNLIIPGVVFGKSSGATPVIMFPAPGDNISRLIDDFYIYNADTVTQVVQISLYDGTNTYRLRRFSLATLTNFQYGNYRGFLG